VIKSYYYDKSILPTYPILALEKKHVPAYPIATLHLRKGEFADLPYTHPSTVTWDRAGHHWCGTSTRPPQPPFFLSLSPSDPTRAEALGKVWEI
jgi:hypothetical protein